MGLFDVLFLLLIVWWIFRAMGGGRAPEEEDRPGRPAPDRRQGSVGPDRESESEWRRRLREAVQEWELEQRRRSGEPIAGTEPTPAPEARMPAPQAPVPAPEAHASERRGDGGSRIQEVRDVTARREGLGPEIGEADEPPEPRRAGARRGQPTAGRRRPEPGRRERLPSARPGPRLPGFDRRSHLQRAILYMEILGPPRAASDRPWHQYRP